MLISLPPELAVTASIAAQNPYIRSLDQPIFSPSVSSYTEHLFYARRPSVVTNEIMPRPNPPPTPGSSSDIRGKEGAHAPPTFNLPPTAYQEPDRASTSSATPSANGSDSSYRPASPTSPGQTRKRPASQSGPIITKDDFALPPPPTRSRKIIQMKPRDNETTGQLPYDSNTTTPVAGRSQASTQTGGKRKQNNSGTTAAGRKIARKTAHSLIERRRRSKMNEEFGVLKDMIPACKGQEMHKLAILQASIEYLRYLEQCVADLKAQNTSPRQQAQPTYSPEERNQIDDDDEDDEDEEMEDNEEAEASTPVTRSHDQSSSAISLPSLSQITTAATTSPSIFSSGAGRHYSISSASQASYSPYFHSNQTSPAFGPQLNQIPSSAGPYRETFGLGSPALKPLDSAQQLRQVAESANELSEKQRPGSGRTKRSEHELDQEATAALLMLNHDRRNWRAAQSTEGARSNTGMSVRDLLSG